MKVCVCVCVCGCVGVCVWVWPIYRTYRTSITHNFGRGPGLKHANGKIKMLYLKI